VYGAYRAEVPTSAKDLPLPLPLHERDGIPLKKDALFATNPCPRSGYERFHKSQLDLVTDPEKTFIGKLSRCSPATNHPSKVSLERLKGKLSEHFSSFVQFDEQGHLQDLARIERYLKSWLSWAKGAGIALPNFPLFGRGNGQTTPENRQRDLLCDDITFYPMESPVGESTKK